MKKRNLFSFLRKYDELSFLLVRVNGEPWGAVERKAVSDVHKSSQMMERDSTHTSWFINILFIYISTLSISSFILVIILSLCFMKKKSTDVRFMTVCLCFFLSAFDFLCRFWEKIHREFKGHRRWAWILPTDKMSVKWSSPSSALMRSFLLFLALFNTKHVGKRIGNKQ